MVRDTGYKIQDTRCLTLETNGIYDIEFFSVFCILYLVSCTMTLIALSASLRFCVK